MSNDTCKKVEEILMELHNPYTGFNAMYRRFLNQYGGKEKLINDIKILKYEKPEREVIARLNAIACKKILEHEKANPGDIELKKMVRDELEQIIYNEFITIFNSALQSEDKIFHDTYELKNDLDMSDERKHQLSLYPYIFSKYHYYANCLNATTAFYYLAQKRVWM